MRLHLTKRHPLGVLVAALGTLALIGGGSTAATAATAVAATCGPGDYVNSSGDCIHDPAGAPGAPPGATAQCGDGTYSFSQHRDGTCSDHSGVQRWL
ncbi:MAG: hypothetical protein JWN03_908 [Nocardia sp.]|uniref:DUF3761 domain-containing protein n=1 Tax=Nocardia sp. TaxID=1821 RepID=UPI00261BF0B5|nr:DUF3761 domain-containing protein [Nocardia sp.]MCU1640633.1 hypothetical protein [Nocardia sp.]